MTEDKRFEPDEEHHTHQYDYSILNSRYEANTKRNEIIEWNKDSCNAQYVGLKRIAEKLNFKQMQLEECRKGYEKLYKENEELKQEIEKVTESNECLLTQKRTWKKMSDEYAKLYEENDWLKQQLLHNGDDVCGNCKHEYLAPSEDYFIVKCKKGHEECSKEDIKYCEDFELKGDVKMNDKICKSEEKTVEIRPFFLSDIMKELSQLENTIWNNEATDKVKMQNIIILLKSELIQQDKEQKDIITVGGLKYKRCYE